MLSALVARTGRDATELAKLLHDAAVTDAGQLVTLSRALDDLESEVTDVQPAR